MTSEVRYQNKGTVTQSNVSTCDIIDRTVFDIDLAKFMAVITTGTGTLQYGARAAGAGPYFASTDSAPASDLRNFSVPNGTSAYSSARCDDATIRWYSTPTEAENAGGLVYVRANFPTVPGNTYAYMAVMGLKLRTTYAATINGIYPTAVTHTQGSPIPADLLIRNVARVWNTGITSVDNGILNDHLQVVPMKTTSRVTKDIVAVNGTASTNPTNVSPGSTLTYQIQPRYSTTFPPQPGTFTVTDILPPNVTYVPGSATLGGAAGEPQVQANTPAQGYTRLVWNYSNVTPYIGPDGAAANLPAIRFNVTLGNLIPNNSKIVNAVAVSAGSSDYDADCTYSTATTNFGTCVKSATNSTTVQTTAGYRLQKTTPTTIIEPGQPFSFQIGYASFGQMLASSDIPDIIDILPYVGDGSARTNFQGRTPPSTFSTGAYQLVSVTPPSNDTGVVVTYTSATPSTINSDPRDASNAAGGSTRWCTQAQFGTAGCPTSMAQVTAVRLHPSVTSFPADTVYTATLNLQSSSASKAGDLFNNSVGSRSLSGNLDYLEVPADSPVRVVASSLSGQVFTDLNQNGVLESGSDTPVAGACITLTGTTSGGSSVTYSAFSQADGTYAFAPGLAGSVYSTADCTGTAIPTFSGLLSGSYTLKETQPAGYADGADYAGTLGGTVSADTVSGITLGVNQSGSGYNFTELPIALSLAKKVDPAYVRVIPAPSDSTALTYVPADRQMTYTLTVRNPGNVAVSNVKLTDALPAGVTFVKAAVDGTALTPGTLSPLTLTLPSLAANTTKDVLVTVTLNPVTANTNQSAILNTASAEATGVAAVSSQQVRTDLVYTRLFKQVRNLTRGSGWSSTSSGYPGDILEYCIDAYNYSSVALSNYSIQDRVPDNSEFIANSIRLNQGTMTAPAGAFPSGSAGYASSTNSVVATGMTLNPGDTGHLCFAAKIK